jgi:Cytochrome c554 and c-prime
VRSRSWRYGLACAAVAAAATATQTIHGRAARAAARDWTGSARCGSCHPRQLAAWRATAHARPFFPAPRPPGIAVCLGCHTTGESPAGPVIEAVVGCEACHGGGADYAFDDVMRNRRLALDLGLAEVSSPAGRAAVCAGCHVASTTTRSITMRPGIDLAKLAHPEVAAAAPSPVPPSTSSPASSPMPSSVKESTP